MKRVHILFRKSFLSGICIFIFSLNVSSQCVNTFPYSEGFETVSTWTLSGPNSDWALGTPAHPTINSAGGGTKSWCVGGLTGSFYNNAEQAAIVSPCFDLTTLSYPWISFKIFWECEFNYDGLVLQYTTNNGSTWTNIGAFGDPNDCNTANWFNHNNISKLTSITTRHGWSGRIGASASGCSGGNGSGGWVTAKHCLTGLANLTNVRFRFLFGSGTTCNNFDGIAIDDIVISNGISNVANFNFTCNGPGSYNFNAVTAPCPAPGTFDWDFGDPSSGASNISASQNPSHVFSAPGTYTVSLIVKGGQCNPPDTITQTVIVSNVSDPVAQDITCFGLNNGSASVLVTGANPISYNWLPSGGNSASAINLSAGNYSVIITDVNNCSYTKTISITEPPVLTSTIQISNASCGLANGSATASANGGTGSYSYLWSPTGGNSSVAGSLAVGNYTITITDANNCSVTKSINLGQAPSLSLSVNSLTLCNNQAGNLTANVVGGTSPYSYNWNGTVTPSGSFPVIGGATISYPVLVTDANGCISNPDTAKLFVVAPLVINVSPDDTICSGNRITLFVNATGGNGNYSYAWQPNGSDLSSFTISATAPQVYNVTVNDGCGSSQAGTVSVNIYSVPASSFIASQTSGCQPLCVTFSDPTLLTSGIITSWNWSFGDSTSASSNPDPNHCYDKSGTFSIKLLYTTNKGCTGTQVINNYIKVFPKPKAEFSASTFEADVYNTTIEFYNQTQNASYYNWSFEAGAFSGQQNPTYTFMHEGHYKVFLAAENTYGCIDTISKDVYIVPDFTFYAPNAFTPNGDGLNDRFFPKGAGWDPAKYELYVFDRWGEKIFQTKDPLEGWDGRVHGKDEIIETDVYVWKVIITDVFKERHQFAGHVTLNK